MPAGRTPASPAAAGGLVDDGGILGLRVEAGRTGGLGLRIGERGGPQHKQCSGEGQSDFSHKNLLERLCAGPTGNGGPALCYGTYGVESQ
jgi:hypothetical protein